MTKPIQVSGDAAASRPNPAPGVSLPVASVAVDSPLPHLDRRFDYRVPAELDEAVQVGSRVRVRFAGRLVDGWVLERREASEHPGALSPVQRGIGGDPVLTAETTALFRAVADRWAGSFADVMRLAVPNRHARAEAADAATEPTPVGEAQSQAWAHYGAGPAFVSAVRAGRAARAVWNCLPDEDWAARIAELVHETLAAGRGAIVVVPDGKDVSRVEAAMAHVMPVTAFVSLTAQLGSETRYRRWLSVRRRSVRAVIGTRSAVYAPVHDLGLIVIFDDGDDLLAEPRAPYPHARDVAILRSSMTGCALLVGGYARTAEGAQLVDGGWAHEVIADRSLVRQRAPRIVAAGDDFELARDPAARTARLSALAFRTARAALEADRAVLVQVPRSGYAPSLTCARDLTPVTCGHCRGPVGLPAAGASPSCRWCGRAVLEWHCPRCKSTATRATVVGATRTAEEVGRAFPSVPVRNSSAGSVLAEVPRGRSIVIATPGAEPGVEGGYGATLLLDGWALLTRPDLRAGEEALRRWFNAAALTATDGTVVIGADAELRPTQALIRWDPAGAARAELLDRQALNFPPASRLAAISGAADDVARLLAAARLPSSADELGAVPVEATGQPRDAGQIALAADGQPVGNGGGELIRTLLRVPRQDGGKLAEALHAAAATLSAKKAGGPVRITLDPVALG